MYGVVIAAAAQAARRASIRSGGSGFSFGSGGGPVNTSNATGASQLSSNALAGPRLPEPTAGVGIERMDSTGSASAALSDALAAAAVEV
jgi:hypothetical protein